MRCSIFTLFTAVGLVAAYTQPKGDEPLGNPTYAPGRGDIVPVGKPYTIKWTPTTTYSTITILLLRGPSDLIQPLYPIAEKIPNTGSYTWTPSTSLESDTTHYGIQLICDSDGKYQYTPQFGISGGSGSGSGDSTSTVITVLTTTIESATATTTCTTTTDASGAPESASKATTEEVVSASASVFVLSTYTPSSTVVVETTSATDAAATPTTSATRGSVASETTGAPTTVSSVVTGGASGTSTPAIVPQQTGAAGRQSVGQGVLGAVGFGAVVLAWL